MCENCGHFFASPALDPDGLADFYRDGFDGDGGAGGRLVAGTIAAHKIRTEEKKMRRWALPKIKEYLDPKGKRILDIRSRSGALCALLAAEGADVTGIDPLQANVDYAKSERGLENICLPMERWYDLTEFEDQSFDAVTALTIHSLAHIPAPRRFLTRLFELAKPGAFLFFDEKTVLEPAEGMTPSLFDSGIGHFHHYTTETAGKVFSAAGFDLVRCELEPNRKSFVRHIQLVAQKPLDPAGRSQPRAAEFRCDTQALLQRLARAEAVQRRVRFKNILRRKYKLLKRRFA